MSIFQNKYIFITNIYSHILTAINRNWYLFYSREILEQCWSFILLEQLKITLYDFVMVIRRLLTLKRKVLYSPLFLWETQLLKPLFFSFFFLDICQKIHSSTHIYKEDFFNGIIIVCQVKHIQILNLLKNNVHQLQCWSHRNLQNVNSEREAETTVEREN